MTPVSLLKVKMHTYIMLLCGQVEWHFDELIPFQCGIDIGVLYQVIYVRTHNCQICFCKRSCFCTQLVDSDNIGSGYCFDV